MAEYWKSTPKYWCKHCSIYVRDTKFERGQHETTAKHQGNLKRFLRGVHQEHEKEEREKQRAKAEIDRLKGLVGGGPAKPASVTQSSSRPKASASSSQASAADRKKQIAQLAEMGIAVPDEFRGEFALAGQWQTVSRTPANETQQPPGESLSVGIRKRKLEGDEEAEEGGGSSKKGWGSTTKTYPGASSKTDTDLDDLLAGGILPKKESTDVVKSEDASDTIEDVRGRQSGEEDKTAVKREIEAQDAQEARTAAIDSGETTSGVVFKKRKPKFAKNG